MECQVKKNWKFPTHFTVGVLIYFIFCRIYCCSSHKKTQFLNKWYKNSFFPFPEEKFDLYNEACSETPHFGKIGRNYEMFLMLSWLLPNFFLYHLLCLCCKCHRFNPLVQLFLILMLVFLPNFFLHILHFPILLYLHLLDFISLIL